MTGPLAARQGRPYVSSVAMTSSIDDTTTEVSCARTCPILLSRVTRGLRTPARGQWRAQFFGCQWTAAGRYADEAAVFVAFDLEVERGVRGVRVLDGDGRQLACVWPGRAAA